MSALSQREALLVALANLALETGASANRAVNVAELHEVRSVRDFPSDQRKSRIQDVLYAAAAGLDGSVGRAAAPKREVVHAVLALGDYSGLRGLDNRRDTLAGSHGVKPGTTRGWQREVMPEFADALLNLTPDEVVPRTPLDDREAPDTTFRELSASIHWTYKGRVPVRHLATRTLVAVHDIDTYPLFFAYPEDAVHGAVRVVPITNCLPGEPRLQATKQYEIPVQLPPTRRGERVTFSYLIEVLSGHDDRPYVRHRARYPSADETLSVCFDPDFVPESVSPFEGKTAEYDPGSGDPAAALFPNSVGTVTRAFPARLDTYFGFSWVW